MSSSDTCGLTPAELREIADEVERRWPDAILVKNPVGNINARIIESDGSWYDVAWCDLRFGGVESFSGHADEDAPSDITVTPGPLSL